MNRQYKRLARTIGWMLSAALVQTASAGIASVERTTQAGTVVAYAGAPGELVSDGVRNSPYAEALLRYLDAPLDVGSMLRSVRDSVLESTSGTQEPVAHVSLPGRSVYLAANPASRLSESPPAEETVRRADSRRVALTIGNAAYEHVNPLRNSLNDAVAISSSLERLGFSVTLLADTDKAALETGLRVFRAQAANAEIAVVYYSGHGVVNAGNHCLVPVDARLRSIENFDDEVVPLDLVMRAVKPASVLRLIMLDAMFPARRKQDDRR